MVRSLGWYAGQRLEIRAVAGSVLVARRADGVFALTSQGYLRLPATIVLGEVELVVSQSGLATRRSQCTTTAPTKASVSN